MLPENIASIKIAATPAFAMGKLPYSKIILLVDKSSKLEIYIQSLPIQKLILNKDYVYDGHIDIGF